MSKGSVVINANPVMSAFRKFEEVMKYHNLQSDEKSYVAGALLMYQMTLDVSQLPHEDSMLQMSKIYKETLSLGMTLDTEIFGKVRH